MLYDALCAMREASAQSANTHQIVCSLAKLLLFLSIHGRIMAFLGGSMANRFTYIDTLICERRQCHEMPTTHAVVVPACLQDVIGRDASDLTVRTSERLTPEATDAPDVTAHSCLIPWLTDAERIRSLCVAMVKVRPGLRAASTHCTKSVDR